MFFLQALCLVKICNILSLFLGQVNPELEEKLKLQQQESTRRENVLVMRLATKEQEMQELLVRSRNNFSIYFLLLFSIEYAL